MSLVRETEGREFCQETLAKIREWDIMVFIDSCSFLHILVFVLRQLYRS